VADLRHHRRHRGDVGTNIELAKTSIELERTPKTSFEMTQNPGKKEDSESYESETESSASKTSSKKSESESSSGSSSEGSSSESD